jgi:hypothetical protein
MSVSRHTDEHCVRKWCPVAEPLESCPWYRSHIESVLEYRSLARRVKTSSGRDEEQCLAVEPGNMLVQKPFGNLEGIWYVNGSQHMLHIQYSMFSYLECFTAQHAIEQQVAYLRRRYCLFEPNYGTSEWQRRVKECEAMLKVVPIYTMKYKAETVTVIGGETMRKRLRPKQFVRLRNAEAMIGQLHERWWTAPYETCAELEQRLLELSDDISAVLTSGKVSVLYPVDDMLGRFAVFLNTMLHSHGVLRERKKAVDKGALLKRILELAPPEFVPPARIYNHELLDELSRRLTDGTYILESTFHSVAVFYVLNFSLNMFVHTPLEPHMRLVLDMDAIVAAQFGGTFEDMCVVDLDTHRSFEYGPTADRDASRAKRYLVFECTSTPRQFELKTEDEPGAGVLVSKIVRNSSLPPDRVQDAHTDKDASDREAGATQYLYSSDDWKIYYCIRRCFYCDDMVSMDSNFRHSYRVRGLFGLCIPRRKT